MKWAWAVILSSRVRPDALSTQMVNQAGSCGSKKPTFQALRSEPSTCAFVTDVQSGTGSVIGSCSEACQRWPGSLSQRLEPIATAAGPFRIRYVIWCGALNCQSVSMPVPGPEERWSCTTSVSSERQAWSARLRTAPAGGAERGTENETVDAARFGPVIAT